MSKFLVAVGIVALFMGVLYLNAWVVMLISGAIGHVFEAPAFFISFGQAVIVTVVLSIVGGFFKNN